MAEKEKERLTTEALKKMSLGETRTFWQGDALGIESGRALASRGGRVLGCRFSTSADYVDNTITVTKGL